ncbi:fumarylacetoacetate hydrolase family protein [Mesorhizobium sp. CN2-181]|uniref:fumarylacetoacetate hydrolase family protein n=1 Tax=Mesorhizobium yinganensis TaxID=3157707 RepID=UPI0032B748C1
MTARYFFAPQDTVGVPVVGSEKLYPVGRIFCVGRNYAEHAKEMGHEVDREAPFYFTKPASAIVASGGTIPYPPGTQNFHHEMEFVVALGGSAFRVAEAEAMGAVFGYACGLDLTRRDLQQAAKDKGRPWDLAKAFEHSAVISPITPASAFGAIGAQRIHLSVNGEIRQDSRLSDLIWSVPSLISHLSRYYHLQAGDLIYTGTPAGVGKLVAGDRLEGGINGLGPIALTIGPAE